MIGKKHKSITGIVLCMTLLAGCQTMGQKGVLEEDAVIESVLPELQEEKEFFYEVPRIEPSVLVDRVGYEKKSKKIAVFRGKNLKDTFEVIDVENGEPVYTGKIISRYYNEETKEYTNYGSFTELDKNGTYYIQTPVIGQSYPFVIGDDLYSGLLPEMEKHLFYKRCGFDLREDAAGAYAHAPCHLNPIRIEGRDSIEVSGGWHTGEGYRKDVAEGCAIVTNLLLAYEMYPGEFTDDIGIAESENQIPDLLDEIRYEMEWLLKMQSPKTGGVFAGATNFQITKEATANFAGVMAGFYQIYKDYDAVFAKTCLDAGIKAWNYQQRNDKKMTLTQEMYFAAAQLYRATGEIRYHTYIASYLRGEQSILGDRSRELYGDVIYLMTRRKVDVAMCRGLMDKWMEKAEAIVSEAQSDAYFIAGEGNAQILDNMFCLSVIGHVITNHEYATILENHLHYFLGRNEQGSSYIEGVSQTLVTEEDRQNAVTSQPQLTSILIFVLGEVVYEDKGSGDE